MRFNVAQLVADLGGASAAAKIAGTCRTAPYRWIENNFISSRVLEAIKAEVPFLSIDRYFEEENADEPTAG